MSTTASASVPTVSPERWDYEARERSVYAWRAVEAAAKRDGMTTWQSLPAPWSWATSAAMYATTGLYFVVGHSKDGQALLVHAAPTAKEALGGTHHEPLSLATAGKKTRAIGVALTQAMRELEHIERTVGLDRGLAFP